MPRFAALILSLTLFLSSRASENAEPVAPRQAIAVPSASIKNLFSLSTNLYSGSTPESDAAFAELKKLGIKTIVSVDGAAPDAERARKFGMRYIHLPLGYNRASESNCVRILKAAEVSEGPVMVHCHHGMHRGPAAAALIGKMNGWSTQTALEFLETAGTSREYPGLFEQVATFKVPTREELARAEADLPEKARVADLVEAMVRVDGHWQNLHQVRKADYKTPANSPDVRPEAEAVLLAELYREALRTPEVQGRSKDFIAQMEAAEKEAWELQRFFKVNSGRAELDRKRADALFARVQERCTSCHKAHRN